MVDFAGLFAPQSIAVIGASSSSGGVANNFLRNLRELGFAGRVYAVHPSSSEIEGWPAYPTIASLPEPVDYAYVAVAAARTPDLLRAAAGRVRFAQVISSGFAEAGAAGLEAELVAACRDGGTRLLGPNCLGLYLSGARVSFISGVSMAAGGVAVLSQSGGLGADILRRGQVRGLRFASLVTLGNSADLGPVDLLRPLLDDAAVRVIGLYLEDARDGRGFFTALREAGARKPVVILKGGRTAAGQRASASHTGALAGDDRLWQALSRQTGAVLVDTLDAFLDALLVFQCLEPRPERPTQKVVLFGNGGGTSVLATDAFSRAGFAVPPLTGEALAMLEAMQLPPGSSIVNPIDTPAGTLRQERGALGGRILAAVGAEPSIDAVVMHLNIPVITAYSDPEILPNLIRGALEAQGQSVARPHFLLVLRSDGELEIEAEKQRFRQAALDMGVPVLNELSEAAGALACMAAHERFLRMASLLPLERVDEIGSTSEALKARAAAGSGEVALLARRQVAGRGRMGRTWLSVEGNLHLSVLLRPGAIRYPGHWSLLSALALADAVRPHVPDPALLRLKWPNDVLLGGGKLAGILLESAAGPAPWLVIGFGVNLAGAPAGLDRAVACLAAFGPAPEPVAFAPALLTALANWRARYAAEGFAPIQAAWLAAAHRPGDTVTARLGQEQLQGTFRGLGADGSLLLEDPTGPHAIMAGEIG